MHYSAKLFFSAMAVVAIGITGCSDDDDSGPQNPLPTTGAAVISFTHLAGGQPLHLNSTDSIVSPGNQKYIVTDFKYYVSNIKLLSAGDTNWTQAESYHFVNHSTPDSKIVSLTNIPPGTYDTLVFAIGVDSVRNHTGAQTGALDPANGMLWDWNTGYKFLQMEGNSFASPQANDGLLFHIGRDENYRIITMPLTPALVVTKGSNHAISIKTELNRMFGTSDAPVLFNEVHTVMGIGNSEVLANNYANMFSLEGIYQVME